MKQWLTGFLLLALTGCATASPIQIPISHPASLSDLGVAPELTNTTWLNTDSPLRLAYLRGTVVALEMWTFACINCQHVLPWLKSWYKTYKDQGFTIIGNHYPEFGFEADLNNLKDAVAQNDIEYPVTQDNDGATWNAYENMYWPALYLIDKRSHIRYVHIGEGAYDEIETNIKTLLAEVYP